MKTDIKETKDCYEFVVEVPGVKKDDLKMELHEGNLIVSYEIKNDDNEKKDNYIINERKVRSASRSYYLGRDYKEEDIKAKFDDGFALVRASNTGPNITMRFEAKDENRLTMIRYEFEEELKKYL